jgi:hypothetical protein
LLPPPLRFSFFTSITLLAAALFRIGIDLAALFLQGLWEVLAPLGDLEWDVKLGAVASNFSLPNNDCLPLGP